MAGVGRADSSCPSVTGTALEEKTPEVMTETHIQKRAGNVYGSGKKRPKEEKKQHGNQLREWTREGLGELVERGVLQMGCKLECDHCGSISWYPVVDMAPKVKCTGCLSAFSLRPEPKWSYRVNALVANALRRDGILAVLEALDSLKEPPSAGFAWVPSLDVFEADSRIPYTDLDLVVLRDGRLLIGEVKSSPMGFDDDTVRKLGDVAEDVEPDEVIFAARGASWPPDVKARLSAARERLATAGISTSEILLRW